MPAAGGPRTVGAGWGGGGRFWGPGGFEQMQGRRASKTGPALPVLSKIHTMKTLTKYLTLNVPSKMEFVNITTEVEEAVRESGVKEGLCLVNTMHITSSVFINDDEQGLHHDFGAWLEQLAPF